jgi:3-deoxy-D-manno-octulosonate 8-phosphate phosphatase (KDO 8-P phosphatase)
MNKKIKDIKIILMDVDGVLTDGRIVLGKEEELKFFHIKDGQGIGLAKRSGLKVGIITGRKSKAVERRGKELKIDYISQGSNYKLDAVDKIIKAEKIDYKNVCYIGDDLVDVPVFKKVGFSATVNDASDYIKSLVSYVSSKSGGKGAVREIIEYILKERGVLDSTVNDIIKEWSK